jgi:hypothetical protein
LCTSTQSTKPSEDGKVDGLIKSSIGEFDIGCALSGVAVAICSIARREVYGTAVRRLRVTENGES